MLEGTELNRGFTIEFVCGDKVEVEAVGNIVNMGSWQKRNGNSLILHIALLPQESNTGLNVHMAIIGATAQFVSCMQLQICLHLFFLAIERVSKRNL